MWPSDNKTLKEIENLSRPQNRWLNSKEASQYLGVTVNALRIMVHRNLVKSHKLGNRLRFRVCELDDLLQEKI